MSYMDILKKEDEKTRKKRMLTYIGKPNEPIDKRLIKLLEYARNRRRKLDRIRLEDCNFVNFYPDNIILYIALYKSVFYGEEIFYFLAKSKKHTEEIIVPVNKNIRQEYEYFLKKEEIRKIKEEIKEDIRQDDDWNENYLKKLEELGNKYKIKVSEDDYYVYFKTKSNIWRVLKNSIKTPNNMMSLYHKNSYKDINSNWHRENVITNNIKEFFIYISKYS